MFIFFSIFISMFIFFNLTNSLLLFNFSFFPFFMIFILKFYFNS
jgi:hypothetical protein